MLGWGVSVAASSAAGQKLVEQLAKKKKDQVLLSPFAIAIPPKGATSDVTTPMFDPMGLGKESLDGLRAKGGLR